MSHKHSMTRTRQMVRRRGHDVANLKSNRAAASSEVDEGANSKICKWELAVKLEDIADEKSRKKKRYHETQHWQQFNTNCSAHQEAYTGLFQDRAKDLLNKGRELHRLSGCEVTIRLKKDRHCFQLNLKEMRENGVLESETESDALGTMLGTDTASGSLGRNLSPSTTGFTRSKRAGEKLHSSATETGRCQLCGVVEGSVEDLTLNSPWMGCDVRGCTHWIHASCIGIVGVSADAVKNIPLMCHTHRDKAVAKNKRTGMEGHSSAAAVSGLRNNKQEVRTSNSSIYGLKVRNAPTSVPTRENRRKSLRTSGVDNCHQYKPLPSLRRRVVNVVQSVNSDDDADFHGFETSAATPAVQRQTPESDEDDFYGFENTYIPVAVQRDLMNRTAEDNDLDDFYGFGS